MQKLTGAQLLVRCLIDQGVDTIFGYPGGTVLDIYDAASAPREIYVLEADVQPGNSGGPLLDGDGEVLGVVFARGTGTDEVRGYAITTDELTPVLGSVTADSPSVSSGTCTG